MVSCANCLPPAVSGSGVRCGRACWAWVWAVPSPSWLGCRGVFIALFFLLGVPVPGLVVPLPPSPFFRARLLAFFFFSWCVSACFGVPFPGGPLFVAWCCRLWLGGPPVPLLGSCLRCLLGGGLAASGGVGGRFGGCGLFSRPPPPPSVGFFFGGGLPVPPSAFPGLAHALARIQCCLPGCCWRLRSVWACSGPMGRVGYVHGGLGAPSCRVMPFGLCNPPSTSSALSRGFFETTWRFLYGCISTTSSSSPKMPRNIKDTLI